MVIYLVRAKGGIEHAEIVAKDLRHLKDRLREEYGWNSSDLKSASIALKIESSELS